jgi:hypothetical protein
MCMIAARDPTHLALPGEFLRPLLRLFEGRLLATFTEPRFGHVTQPFERVVSLIKVSGLRPEGQSMCRRLVPKREP